MLKPLDAEVNGEETPLICCHWKKWPPPHASSGEPFETFRNTGEITEAMYQQAKIWERLCGLTQMNGEKCPGCPLVRRLERRQFELYAVALDGSAEHKITDLAGNAAAPRYRRKTQGLASWLINIHFQQEQQEANAEPATDDES